MYEIVIVCFSLAVFCAPIPPSKAFATLKECDAAIERVARDFDPGSRGAYTFNCRKIGGL